MLSRAGGPVQARTSSSLSAREGGEEEGTDMGSAVAASEMG